VGLAGNVAVDAAAKAALTFSPAVSVIPYSDFINLCAGRLGKYYGMQKFVINYTVYNLEAAARGPIVCLVAMN
jgi:hypothetical protein